MIETTDWQTYRRVSRTGSYGFLAALPLIVAYEVLIAAAHGDAVAQVRIGAEVWLKQLFALIGDTGMTLFGIAVVVIGLVIFFRERKQRIPIRARYFTWMFLESAIYAVLVAIMVSGIVGAILMAAPAVGTSNDLLLYLVLSIGAGVYEELLFRVVLVGGLYLLLREWIARRAVAYAVAAVVGAFFFSLVHYLGPLGDVFAVGSFLFRFLFGLALNVIFLTRGFGIAAWTHALYDVLLVVGFFG